jgi:hypothetical protein
MPRKPEPLEPWMLEAINLMLRQNLSLRQAAQQLGVDITPQQADNIAGRVRFMDALEEARLKYYAEIGSNPRLTRDTIVGQYSSWRAVSQQTGRTIKRLTRS